jgi:DNA-binding CsgD family transcriptional regulator
MNPYLELLAEQQKTNKLLAVLVTRDLSRTEQVLLLNNAGFKPSEIAGLIGTTPNTVSVTIAQNKRKTKKNG